jgi:small subunit ribosomal protein S4e
MKRLTAPRAWPVPRKTTIWIAKPSPGSHGIQESMPLVIVLRDVLGLADTAREVKRILGDRQVLVDGRVVTDLGFPVGLMDVVSIPKIDLNYRMLLDRNGKFRLVKVAEGKQGWKLCRTRVRRQWAVATQLNLHDGATYRCRGTTSRRRAQARIAGQKILTSASCPGTPRWSSPVPTLASWWCRDNIVADHLTT